MTRRRWMAAVGGAALAAAVPGRAQTRERAMDDVVAINFSRDVGWSGQEVLELAKSGPSTVALSFNPDGRPEIGLWRATLPPERFAAALAAVQASGYESVPGPSQVAPGAKLVSLGVRRATEPAPRMRAFPARPVPPPIAPVVSLLEAAIAEIRQNPRRVLAGRAEARAARVERGADLLVQLTLTNAGVEPLQLVNPTARAPGEWTGVRLVFTDGGGGEHAADLKPADLSGSAGAGAAVTLAPGAGLTLQARARADWPAGAGRLRVEVHEAPGDAAGDAFVEGTLWLDAGPLSVEGGPWWKLWR